MLNVRELIEILGAVNPEALVMQEAYGGLDQVDSVEVAIIITNLQTPGWDGKHSRVKDALMRDLAPNNERLPAAILKFYS